MRSISKDMQKQICLVAVCLLAAMAPAQITTTTITGTVSDPGGAAVPGAQVTASNVGTGVSRTTDTNAQGEYRIDLLPVGEYTVEVSANGFKKSKQTGIVLEVSRTARAWTRHSPSTLLK